MARIGIGLPGIDVVTVAVDANCVLVTVVPVPLKVKVDASCVLVTVVPVPLKVKVAVV